MCYIGHIITRGLAVVLAPGRVRGAGLRVRVGCLRVTSISILNDMTCIVLNMCSLIEMSYVSVSVSREAGRRRGSEAGRRQPPQGQSPLFRKWF